MNLLARKAKRHFLTFLERPSRKEERAVAALLQKLLLAHNQYHPGLFLECFSQDAKIDSLRVGKEITPEQYGDILQDALRRRKIEMVLFDEVFIKILDATTATAYGTLTFIFSPSHDAGQRIRSNEYSISIKRGATDTWKISKTSYLTRHQ